MDNGTRRTPHAVLAARWLLDGPLDTRVSSGVSVSWLAARISERHLIEHRWSWEDIAALLHGQPDWPHLPMEIRNPRGWIRARLAAATPDLPPSRLVGHTWSGFLRDRHPRYPMPRPEATPEEVSAADRIWSIVRNTTPTSFPPPPAPAQRDDETWEEPQTSCRYCLGTGYRSFGMGLPAVPCMHTPYESW